jgi:hypothetical protein
MAIVCKLVIAVSMVAFAWCTASHHAQAVNFSDLVITGDVTDQENGQQNLCIESNVRC